MRSILTESKTPFRYMHVSGVLAEKDQKKPLWFLQEGRRTKVHNSFRSSLLEKWLILVQGMAEIKIKELAHDKSLKGSWESYIARPSMVTPNIPGILNTLGGWALGAIRVDQLAAAMIDIVEKGANQETFENADLLAHAQQLEAIGI